MGRQQASKIYKTKRKTREPDQILNDDLKSKASIESLEHQKFDEYLPGLGQFYCIVCAKYFESEAALIAHKKSKIHKRALRNLKFGPYTPEEAAAGAGHNVEKFLAKQQKQIELLKAEDAQRIINREKGNAHKKGSQKPASIEMDIEEQDEMEQPEQQQEQQQQVEEITV